MGTEETTLDYEVALSDPKIKEALALWTSLSSSSPTELEKSLGSLVSTNILCEHGTQALKNNDLSSLQKVLKRMHGTSFSYEYKVMRTLTADAVKLGKLELWHDAAISTDTLLGSKLKDEIYNYLEASFAQPDTEELYNQIKAIPAISKQQSLKMALSIDNMRPSSQVLETYQKFVVWMQRQERELTPEERSEFHLKGLEELNKHITPATLKMHPSLLEFKGFASQLAAFAVTSRNLELLEHIESTNTPFDKESLLTTAIKAGPNPRKAMILWMLLHKYPTGSALSATVDNKLPKFTNLLLQNGADVNADPSTLCKAIETGDAQLVKKLIDYGADCNAQIPLKSYKRGMGDYLTPFGAAVTHYSPHIFPTIADRTIFDERTHGFVDGVPAPFAPFIADQQNKYIMPYLQILAEKRKPIKLEAVKELNSDIELS